MTWYRDRGYLRTLTIPTQFGQWKQMSRYHKPITSVHQKMLWAPLPLHPFRPSQSM